MRYFVPVLKLSEELGPQTALQDKLGGVPWGLTAGQWPKCVECGKSQSLLAQFVHDAERLDLGRAGRVMSVFHCGNEAGDCATWEGGSGTNACVLSEPEELVAGLAELPMDMPPVEREARVVSWLERDDGLKAEVAAKFYSDAAYFALAEDVRGWASSATHLGGVPSWVQSPDEAPEGWRFVGQLSCYYGFFRAPDVADAYAVDEDPEGYTHCCDGPNFGDGGTAYLFLKDRANGVPEGWFFWQCG
jgi:hypothetical protein